MEAVAALVAKVPAYADAIGLLMMAVVLLSTVLVRIAFALESVKPNALDPAKIAKAKEIVAKAGEYLGDILHYFPTLLKNPRTQQMEDLLAKLNADPSAAPVGLILTTVEQAVRGPQAAAAQAADPSGNAKTGS